MQIALNIHYVRPLITGGGETYAVELLRALAKIDHRNEYLVICNREGPRLDLPLQKNFQIIYSPVSASARPSRYAWEQLVLPVRIRNRGFDLIHSMGYVAPVLSHVKHVVTVPDANWQELESLSTFKRLTLGFFARRSAAAASAVITGTQAAAETLARHLPIDRGRIFVVPLGADHMFGMKPGDCPGIGRPYLLALSSGFPHKNLPRLVQAFARIKDRMPHSLVIAGNMSPDLKVSTRAANLGPRLHCTGHVDDQTLAALFASADLFVFPSWHEGFGLPLLEAQRYGTPVAAAAIPALMEIANGTAELFDPFSTDALANAILNVATSPARRAELAAAARVNAARFSWANTAKSTLSIYEQVASIAAAGSEPSRWTRDGT